MLRTVRLVLIAGLAGFAAAAAATPPQPLTQAVAATQAAKVDYSFDFHLETSKQNWRARFEPNASPRLRLVQPRRDELSGDERRAFDRLAENMEGVSWCAGENMVHVGDVRLLREDEATATYAFQPTRESVRGEQAQRFADRMRGELTLIKTNPDISYIRVFTPAPFSPLPLVRVDRVNVAITCQTAPNGRRFAAETVSDVSGSAFGQDFSERSVQSTRNLAVAP
ncbi:MAG: hypothetical protein ACREH4_09295 [Vitreimonas sp.]